MYVEGGHSSPYDALDAMDHTQWELDKMKRETQQLLKEALELMKN